MRSQLAFIALALLLGTAYSQEITDVYSNTESCDVNVVGDVAGLTLRTALLQAGSEVQAKTLTLDGPGTWVVRWSPFEPVKDSFEVRASLLRGRDLISEKSYEFYYGGIEPIRFDVRDFNADSRGIYLAVSAMDPTIVDIYYMLISGNKAIYVDKDESVPLAGAMPIQIDRPWKQILENGREYAGLVKIVEPSHNMTRSFLQSFTASDDASITETYEDETGASATVLGNSRVPFEGKLTFTLSQNGSTVKVVEKKTPVLLTGDDETVEVSWNETLAPGLYQLKVVLLGNRGDVLDVRESIIEAKPQPLPSPAPEPKKSPLPEASALISLASAALIRRLRSP